MSQLDFLPIGLSLADKRIVVIGGGKVAAQKLRTLTRFSACIFVYARAVTAEIRSMHVEWAEAEYQKEMLEKAFLVFACTSDHELNVLVAKDAREIGALVNAADDPVHCDFVSPAIWFSDSMSVSVLSDAKNAKRSVQWRNAIRSWGENSESLPKG